MILSFTLQNWKSFHESVTFSMVATAERQHSERVAKVSKYHLRVLPIAAIYGGNASGKTNFFKALNFARRLIIRGTQPDSLIPVEPFQLDAASHTQPSKFAFELLIDGDIYAYSFAVTRQEIIEEKLTLIKSDSEKILYHRLLGKPNFDNSIAKDEFLGFVFKGTRKNQLFLTNSVTQNVDNFKPIYNWFKDSLELIAPDSRFGIFDEFIDENRSFSTDMNRMLNQLDTGISHIECEEIPFESLPIPEPLKIKIEEELKENMTTRLIAFPKEYLFVTRKEGELITKKLVTYHAKTDGSETKFEIDNESDGSQRIIDLLPAFLTLSSSKSKKVFIIDEIDRSLHTLATRQLLEYYLSSCSENSRSQLLFTTHDVQLMDQNLLRRDEMWVTERGSFGTSKLFSFSDFKDIRYDKNIRKSYLQGRLGGIPNIILSTKSSNTEVA